MCSIILILMLLNCCKTQGTISKFSKDTSLENRNIFDAASISMTTVSFDNCARECHDNASCLSFLYNKYDGSCQIMAKIHLDTPVNEIEYDNKVFRKQPGSQVCVIPEVLNRGRLLYINGVNEGSTAEFVCDDFYFPTTLAGVCTLSGSWTGLDNACQQKLTPFDVPAQGRIYQGSCVTITATPTGLSMFRFAFTEENGDFNVAIAPRFAYQNVFETTIMNSNFGSTWGQDERHSSIWPFVVGQEFTMDICAEQTQYKFFVDEIELLTYTYRSPPTNVDHLKITLAVSVRSIHFKP